MLRPFRARSFVLPAPTDAEREAGLVADTACRGHNRRGGVKGQAHNRGGQRDKRSAKLRASGSEEKEHRDDEERCDGVEDTPPNKKCELSEERFSQLSHMVKAFVESDELRITMPPELVGVERKAVAAIAKRHGCSSQAFSYKAGRGCVLSVFKGSRFQEASANLASQVADSSAPIASSSSSDEHNSSPMQQCPSEDWGTPSARHASKQTRRGKGKRERRRTSSDITEASSIGVQASPRAACTPKNLEYLSPWQHLGDPAVDVAIGGACGWLRLPAVFRIARTCRSWAALVPRIPIDLSPQQGDAVLEFCLLEVLHRFDDARLPLPVSALYGEMCAVARSIVNCDQSLHYLNLSVLSLDDAVRRRADTSISRDCHPHHVLWLKACSDLRRSGFKSLDKMSKHYHAQQLIGVHVQQWYKRMHHSPNTRTCKELLLNRVNRLHPLITAHSSWRNAFESERVLPS